MAIANQRHAKADQMGGKLLVTGASGMVGRNLLHALEATPWEVLAPSRAALDLMDAQAVQGFIAEHRPAAIVHAAGRVGGIRANIENPVAFLDENLVMGRNVIMGAYVCGVDRLLNLGSSCIYPREAPNPLKEEAILTGPLEPTNEGYALAKIVALRLCEYIRRENPAMKYVTVIPCNLYGPYDKFDPQGAHLVPAVIRKIHEAQEVGAKEVEIWGDGSARREFLFAPDLAAAIVRMLDTIDSAPGEINIGVGRDHSVLEYYRAVARVIGWEGEFTFDLTKPVGMRQKLTDTSRQNQWGWSPSTSLEDGIAATYRHFLEISGQ